MNNSTTFETAIDFKKAFFTPLWVEMCPHASGKGQQMEEIGEENSFIIASSFPQAASENQK